MNPQLSPRDWEYLSAYLDRQLKPKEIVSLEARLSADPVLSAALGEIQRTRDALRSLPRLRAPRNFTLTPQMVGQRSKWRPRPAGHMAPVLGFASALATFVLVLVIVGDLLGILSPAVKPVAELPARTVEVAQPPSATSGLEPQAAKQAPTFAEPPQPTTAAAEDAQALSETAPMSLTVGAEAPFAVSETMTVSETITEPITAKQAAGMGSGMPSETADELPMPDAILTDNGPMWNLTVLVTVSPTETLIFPMTITLDGPAITETIETGVGGGLPDEGLRQVEPTLTTAPEPPPAPAGTPEAAALAAETPHPSQPELQALKPAEAPSPTTSSQAPSPQPARTGRSAVRVIEITLAVLALITSLAALYTWWAKRL
jgi:anti-sigma factor RsiW